MPDDQLLCPRCERERLRAAKVRAFSTRTPVALTVLFALLWLAMLNMSPLSPEGSRFFVNIQTLVGGAVLVTAIWKRRVWRCPACDDRPEWLDIAKRRESIAVERHESER